MAGLSLRGPSSLLPWHGRHWLHKAGVVALAAATLVFTVGMVVPAWTRQAGLWMTCFPESTSCKVNVYSLSNKWINAVRVAECLAFLSFILCMVTAVFQDFYVRWTLLGCSKLVEVLAIMAGIFGITGVIIFGLRLFSSTETVVETGQRNDKKGTTEKHNVLMEPALGWGYGLVAASSILALLSALTIACSRCRDAKGRCSSRTFKTPVPGLSRVFGEEEVTFKTNDEAGSTHDVDASSMMLVPAGHFNGHRKTDLSPSRSANSSLPRVWKGRGDLPPAYALPPPYPYSSNTEFFLPVANSSMIPQMIVDGHGQSGSTMAGYDSSASPEIEHAEQSFLFLHHPTDAGFYARPTETGFIATRSVPGPGFQTLGESSPAASYSYDNSQSNRFNQHPLFVKTGDGTSVEITASAQNSMALPSPFKHF